MASFISYLPRLLGSLLNCSLVVVAGAALVQGCGSNGGARNVGAGSPKIGLSEDLTDRGLLHIADAEHPAEQNEVDFLGLSGGPQRGVSFNFQSTKPAFLSVANHEAKFSCSGSQTNYNRLRIRVVESSTSKSIATLLPDNEIVKIPAGKFKLLVIAANVSDCSEARITFKSELTPESP